MDFEPTCECAIADEFADQLFAGLKQLDASLKVRLRRKGDDAGQTVFVACPSSLLAEKVSAYFDGFVAGVKATGGSPH